MNRSSQCILATTVLALSASAQRIDFTSFEAWPYAVGRSVDGLPGWTTLLSPDAPAVVNGRATASIGRRALSCQGGSPDLTPTQGLLDGAWRRDVTLPANVQANGIVHVQCDVRLDGPDTGSGPANDLVSANLYARNGTGASAFAYLSSTGEVFCFANSAGGSASYRFATDVGLGRYATIGITLDYATHIATFWVNYRVVGQLPFGGTPNEAFEGAILEFAAYDDPQYVNPADYTGYWDDLLLIAVPRC